MNHATQRRCAFLTMDDTTGWSIDADLAVAPLNAFGWQVDNVPWRSTNTNWGAYEAVYVGTPWDYPQDPALFVAALERIEQAGALLINPLELLRWNLTKTYLRDLEEQGADIVPTIWLDRLQKGELDELFERCGSERIIVKPTVSTNATDTFLLAREVPDAVRDTLQQTFAARGCMAQPFIASIQSEGEFSLFYIGGKFSHAIQKQPKERDFRVQEEHGASITAVVPAESLRTAGRYVMALINPAPLYARADFVRGTNDRFLLMELELIEPSMYLRMHDAAPLRFAMAFNDYVNARKRDE